jgi:hypothetical protein
MLKRIQLFSAEVDVEQIQLNLCAFEKKIGHGTKSGLLA